jgi:hypothetical protein
LGPDGDRDLVVELWLYRVADDLSGLTFQEWDPSAGSDDTSVQVEMLVNSSQFAPRTSPVRVLQLDEVARGTTRTSGQDVSEYLDTLGLVKSYFSSLLRKKIKKYREKKNVLVLRRPRGSVDLSVYRIDS